MSRNFPARKSSANSPRGTGSPVPFLMHFRLPADVPLRVTRPQGSGVAQSEGDRRQHRRFQCGGEAEIRSLSSGLRRLGTIVNLSLKGCLVRLGNDPCFRKGEAVEMTFCVRQLPVRVQGFIRQRHLGPGVGVEFTLLAERGKQRLLELIAELDEILRDKVDEPVKE